MHSMLDEHVLITGGTGTFGKAAVRELVKSGCRRVTVFSRDELKQFELQEELRTDTVDYYLGDVRDFARVREVFRGVDTVIHAAAMKQVPASENNPMEAVKTNILGTENIVKASIENGVKRVISLSTDKATNPTSLYGATKLCADKLIITGNSISNNSSTKFSVVRYGNVIGSRGSVIPFFQLQALNNKITLTDVRMTRFWITIEQAVNFVLNRINSMQGGEIFVPKLSSFKVSDIAKIVAPKASIDLIGIRPGEKLHEILINFDEALNTYDLGDYFAIVSPNTKFQLNYSSIGKKVPHNFCYSSDNNDSWFSIESFNKLLKENYLM